ncbi:GH92 family glycosyl hydrolase [Mucilaginibacter myungsuensis]|uniref:GH92 family glycosyl hydrolase n=2 Tax=Mucilaginibacter myungsuensis TaxID=649104 RepID=A0A929L377_9SPHI|nr:GH92 family glycosyl hydrolase [Mucilaginibacter myungsuensis]
MAKTGPTAGGVSKYVNTFVGTEAVTDPKILGYIAPPNWRPWSGLTFPGASLPNAMVQLSPMTKYQPAGAGYEYEDDSIVAFTHTNKGHWNLGNVPILPMSGYQEGSRFGSKFSHKSESAAPGFYSVYLDDYGVKVSLTSTLRTGYHKYEFKNNTDRQILFDLSKALSGVNTWNIEQAGQYAVQGFQGGEGIYFYAQLNTPIAKLDQKDKRPVEENQQRRNNRGNNNKDGYALITLENGSAGPVELKIGLSFVSIANAKENLEKELAGKTFESVRKEAAATWENLLSSIQVKGGTEKNKVMFYSSFYRSFLWPALRSDINGQYRNARRQVDTADFRYYTEPSLWDTYRNKDVLLGMITPKVTTDVIKSMKDVGEKTGFIPTFFHGDHGASSIAGAYLRGIQDFDIKATYKLLLHNANVEGRARPHLNEYLAKGYISDPDVADPKVETKANAGVSKTLEYSYDDYSNAQLAKVLGDTANYRILMARSKNYKNMFDKSVNFMRGRLANGEFIKNFNPEYPYYEYMFREANAWQVSFYAPHDMPGLIDLYGGPKPFEAKLDTFFTKPWNPKYIARNIETFIGQYTQGNQPDHEAPFAYMFIGKPEKTQKLLDKILNELYGMGPNGNQLSGMDDAGELSAWYVFSALGMYPFSATDPKYLVTVPLFDEIKWRTPQGKMVTITKPGKGRTLTSVKVNGKVNKDIFVSHDIFKTGGNITIATK